MRIWQFYLELLRDNQKWIKRAAIWATLWFVLGAITFLAWPELLPRFLELLQKVFREILGEDELVIGWQSVFSIWKQNFTAVVISIFFGIILGLAPLLTIAFNFWILGFIVSAGVFGLGSAVVVLISILPHGIVEIPALILAAALGIRLGFSIWNKEFKKTLKACIQFLPFLALLLLIAAIIEIFITGNLVLWLTK